MKTSNNLLIMFFYSLFLFIFVRETEGYHDEKKFRCDYKQGFNVMGWFKFHIVPATWQNARLICTSEGSMLASPATKAMRYEMTMQASSKSHIFTGLHTTYSKGKYYTVDGIPLDTIPHKWEHQQPDNKDNKENCLAMNPMGLLSDVNCDHPLPFICYRNATAEITNCGTHDTNYVFDGRTKHCYKFHTTPRNFSRAYLVCSAEGGHLAIVNSEEEASVLVDLFSNYPATAMVGPFWKEVALIGIGTSQEGGDWRTIHGETLREAGFEKWSPGEPNNYGGAEFCGSISRKGMLFDSSCVKEYAFICEKSPDYPRYCSLTTTIGIPTIITSELPTIISSEIDILPTAGSAETYTVPTADSEETDIVPTAGSAETYTVPTADSSDDDIILPTTTTKQPNAKLTKFQMKVREWFFLYHRNDYPRQRFRMWLRNHKIKHRKLSPEELEKNEIIYLERLLKRWPALRPTTKPTSTNISSDNELVLETTSELSTYNSSIHYTTYNPSHGTLPEYGDLPLFF